MLKNKKNRSRAAKKERDSRPAGRIPLLYAIRGKSRQKPSHPWPWDPTPSASGLDSAGLMLIV